MEYSVIPMELKANPKGEISGYASRFGELDSVGDVMVKGAFQASLSENGKPKMLWQHDPSQPIGVWDEVKEDETGLHVKGRILSAVEKGREALALISEGALDGMSIGYRTVDAAKGQMGERLLKQVSLWEVSLVTFPALPSARVDAVKAAEMTKRDFEATLMHDAGLSRSVARALMGGGFEAVKAMQDAGSDGLNELAQHMRELSGQ